MFKNWTLKQYIAAAILAVVIITIVVLHLIQPKVSFAFTEIASAISYALGAVSGYLFAKKKQE